MNLITLSLIQTDEDEEWDEWQEWEEEEDNGAKPPQGASCAKC